MDAMETFLAYAGRYDTNDAKIHLKIVHTQAVDAVMERLSEALGLDGPFLPMRADMIRTMQRFI